MAANFCPIFNGWQGFTPGGVPLSGGLVNTYLAGTSTPAATFTTSAAGTPNANPIQLDAGGRPPAEIWLTAGQGYKFVLTDALSNTLASYDNIMGIVNAPSSIWVATNLTPTFLNPTQFSVVGDQTLVFPVGIRIQYTLTSTQFYGSVSAVSFAAGVTTVTVSVDSTPLTSGLNTVNVSQLSPINTPLPITTVSRCKAGTTSRNTTTTLADDPELILPLGAGKWQFEAWLPISAGVGGGANGFKAAMAFSGTHNATDAMAWTASETLVGFTLQAIGGAGATASISSSASPADYFIGKGSITVTVAGNFSVQWAQNSSGAQALNLFVGAYLICNKVG